jgi:hypothetical protein
MRYIIGKGKYALRYIFASPDHECEEMTSSSTPRGVRNGLETPDKSLFLKDF